MLCADCKKNVAVVFVNQEDQQGKIKKIGYCYSCAKKRGLTQVNQYTDSNNINTNDMANVTEQLNDILTDLSNKEIANNIEKIIEILMNVNTNIAVPTIKIARHILFFLFFIISLFWELNNFVRYIIAPTINMVRNRYDILDGCPPIHCIWEMLNAPGLREYGMK